MAKLVDAPDGLREWWTALEDLLAGLQRDLHVARAERDEARRLLEVALGLRAPQPAAAPAPGPPIAAPVKAARRRKHQITMAAKAIQRARAVEGLSVREAAHTLGVTEKSIYNIRRRARSVSGNGHGAVSSASDVTD